MCDRTTHAYIISLRPPPPSLASFFAWFPLLVPAPEVEFGVFHYLSAIALVFLGLIAFICPYSERSLLEHTQLVLDEFDKYYPVVASSERSTWRWYHPGQGSSGCQSARQYERMEHCLDTAVGLCGV